MPLKGCGWAVDLFGYRVCVRVDGLVRLAAVAVVVSEGSKRAARTHQKSSPWTRYACTSTAVAFATSKAGTG